MSKTINVLDAKNMHIASLQVGLLILAVLSVGLAYGWYSAPQNLRITLPPDTRYGATIKPGDYDLPTVYGFAKLTFTAFNRWVEDGQVEFPERIDEYQPYFTPKFIDEVTAVMNVKASNGELEHRSRYVLDVPGWETFSDENIKLLDDGSWVVILRLEIIENIGAVQIKRPTIEYPLHIVRMNISPDKNAYGLAINGIGPGYKERTIK